MSVFGDDLSDVSLTDQWSEGMEDGDEEYAIWVEYRGSTILETQCLRASHTIEMLRSLVEKELGHDGFYLTHDDMQTLHSSQQLCEFSSTLFGVRLTNGELEKFADQMLVSVAKLKK